MKFNTSLKTVGLISALATSPLLFTSCDGGGSSSSSETQNVPQFLTVGDEIEFRDESTTDFSLQILSDTTAEFSYSYSSNEEQLDYQYAANGNSRILTLLAPAAVQDTIDQLNQILSNPNTPLSRAVSQLDSPATEQQIDNVFVEVIRLRSSIFLFELLDYDDNGNFFIPTHYTATASTSDDAVSALFLGAGITFDTNRNIVLDRSVRSYSDIDLSDGYSFKFHPFQQTICSCTTNVDAIDDLDPVGEEELPN